MNKLSFSEPVWLASDIHLGPDNPRTCEAFYRFLAHAREYAGALILLGDIFNVWIGDDWTRRPPGWLSTALDELRRTGLSIPMWILGGNRDFLIGSTLASYLNVRLIKDQCILEMAAPEQAWSDEVAGTGGPSQSPAVKKYLLAHGDEFCTRDTRYQRFRKIVRNPVVQSCFMGLSLSIRERIAQAARQSSMQTVRGPFDDRYDVEDSSIVSRLQALGAQTCIHGHTHKPGHQALAHGSTALSSQDFNVFDRWVLPDWECDHTSGGQSRGGWMEIDVHGPRILSLPDLP